MANHFAEIDGKPHRVVDGQVNLGLAVDVEKKDGSRTLMVPVIRDAGRLPFDRFLRRLRRAGGEGAHEHAHGRRPGGRQHHADQPRRARHGGLGAAADERPGHDRRDRLDRLPGRARQHRREHRRGEGHDDDLDLRPPHHPGRGVRALPGADRGATCRASTASTRSVFASLGVELGRRPRRRARAAAAPRGRAERGRRAVRRRRRAAAGGAGGEHVRQPRPQPRPPRGAPGPARLGARGRPGPGPRGAGADAGDPGAAPGEDLPHVRARARRSPTRCRTCARPTAARSRTRSSTSPPTASACGCASTSSRAPSATSSPTTSAGRCSSAWSRWTRWSASCTRPTSASTSSRSRAST